MSDIASLRAEFCFSEGQREGYPPRNRLKAKMNLLRASTSSALSEKQSKIQRSFPEKAKKIEANQTSLAL